VLTPHVRDFGVADPPQYTKDEIVRLLRRAGLEDAAEEAERVLPEKFDLMRAAEFGMRHGITRDELISRMGGSP